MERKYVITSAQAHASPHGNFLQGLESYVSKTDSELIILPMIGQSAKEDIDQIHKGLVSRLEYGTRKFNSNVQVEQFNVRPYQIDPTTGLARFAQRGTSLIYASPKQRLKVVPHSNENIPKLLMTTGAVTYPNYATGRDVSAERRRLGNIAKRDHVYGAVVVEIEDEEIFHIRNLRANSRGKFVDLGIKYNGKATGEAKLEALVFGDWHVGYTDEKVRLANFDMITQLKPKRVMLHDLFNGHSVCHHKKKELISSMLIEGYDRDPLFYSLEAELTATREELQKIATLTGLNKGIVYVVASNHNEWIDKYLDTGEFVKDPINARIAFKLAQAFADGKNPLEEGMKLIGNLPDNVIFLERDEDLKVKGYQLGSHGDKGPGGGRGSIQSKETDYGKSITGHVHSAEILRDTYIVGTSTPLILPYTKGQPTRWTNTNALLWDTGTVQLVNTINGKWRK